MRSVTECLADNVRTLRKTKHLTQETLAKRAGISLIFLQGIESEKKWVSPTTVKALAKALHVSESRLFENCLEQDKGIPPDITKALVEASITPSWKWEVFRWILDGHRRSHLKKRRTP